MYRRNNHPHFVRHTHTQQQESDSTSRDLAQVQYKLDEARRELVTWQSMYGQLEKKHLLTKSENENLRVTLHQDNLKISYMEKSLATQTEEKGASSQQAALLHKHVQDAQTMWEKEKRDVQAKWEEETEILMTACHIYETEIQQLENNLHLVQETFSKKLQQLHSSLQLVHVSYSQQVEQLEEHLQNKESHILALKAENQKWSVKYDETISDHLKKVRELEEQLQTKDSNILTLQANNQNRWIKHNKQSSLKVQQLEEHNKEANVQILGSKDEDLSETSSEHQREVQQLKEQPQNKESDIQTLASEDENWSETSSEHLKEVQHLEEQIQTDILTLQAENQDSSSPELEKKNKKDKERGEKKEPKKEEMRKEKKRREEDEPLTWYNFLRDDRKHLYINPKYIKTPVLKDEDEDEDEDWSDTSGQQRLEERIHKNESDTQTLRSENQNGSDPSREHLKEVQQLKEQIHNKESDTQTLRSENQNRSSEYNETSPGQKFKEKQLLKDIEQQVDSDKCLPTKVSKLEEEGSQGRVEEKTMEERQKDKEREEKEKKNVEKRKEVMEKREARREEKKRRKAGGPDNVKLQLS